MIVGAVEIKLALRWAHSLKEKRRTIKSLKDRVRNKFNVSIAEVAALDSHQLAVLGVAAVANDGRFTTSVLSKVIEMVRQFPQVELVGYELETR